MRNQDTTEYGFKQRVDSRNVFALLTNMMVVFHFITSLGPQVSRELGWEKPSPGWIKVNTDGSVCGNPEVVSYGRVLRNEDGQWVGGFGANSGVIAITHVGSNECVRIETDSRVVVELLGHGQLQYHLFDSCLPIVLCSSVLHNK